MLLLRFCLLLFFALFSFLNSLAIPPPSPESHKEKHGVPWDASVGNVCFVDVCTFGVAKLCWEDYYQ